MPTSQSGEKFLIHGKWSNEKIRAYQQISVDERIEIFPVTQGALSLIILL